MRWSKIGSDGGLEDVEIGRIGELDLGVVV